MKVKNSQNEFSKQNEKRLPSAESKANVKIIPSSIRFRIIENMYSKKIEVNFIVIGKARLAISWIIKVRYFK